jgi:hypothetical protein
MFKYILIRAFPNGYTAKLPKLNANFRFDSVHLDLMDSKEKGALTRVRFVRIGKNLKIRNLSIRFGSY